MMKEKMKKCTAILLVTMMMGLLFVPVNVLASINVKNITKTYTPSKTGYYTFSFSYNPKNYKSYTGEREIGFEINDLDNRDSSPKLKQSSSKITISKSYYLKAGKKYIFAIWAVDKKYTWKVSKMSTSGTYNGIKYSYSNKTDVLTISGKGKIASKDYSYYP